MDPVPLTTRLEPVPDTNVINARPKQPSFEMPEATHFLYLQLSFDVNDSGVRLAYFNGISHRVGEVCITNPLSKVGPHQPLAARIPAAGSRRFPA
jgi:hypothetical protein